MKLSLNYRFLLKLCAFGVGGNILLNILFVLIAWHSTNSVPIDGSEGLSVYLYISSFVCSLVLCWVVTKCTRAALRRNEILPLHWHLKSKTLIDQLPTSARLRSFMFGIGGDILAGLTLLLLQMLQYETIYLADVLVFIVAYATVAALGTIIVCFYRALGDKITHQAKIRPAI